MGSSGESHEPRVPHTVARASFIRALSSVMGDSSYFPGGRLACEGSVMLQFGRGSDTESTNQVLMRR